MYQLMRSFDLPRSFKCQNHHIQPAAVVFIPKHPKFLSESLRVAGLSLGENTLNNFWYYVVASLFSFYSC